MAPGFLVDASGREGPRAWEARALVAATGTHERVIPMSGWTLPGVVGLGAATVLLKAERMLPGETTLVAGSGPLVAAVAAGIVKGGGRVAAMVDLARPGDWLATLPAMASRPDLLARGLGWLRLVRAAGTPILFAHAVARIHGRDRVEAADVVPVDRDWRPVPGATARTVEADSVAVGHGLVPETRVTRLLGARHAYAAELGGWTPERDRDMRTTQPRLYAAGDGAGVGGAEAAETEGRIAGLAAALDLGKLDTRVHERLAARYRRRLAGARRFGRAMSRLMCPRPGLLETMEPDTVVCRCEDVTRREIEAAVAAGARDLNQLKSWTRSGMGPCQGRMCGEAAAALVAAKVGGREAAGQWTARVPVLPLPIDALVGGFTYDDIPQPQPAPA